MVEKGKFIVIYGANNLGKTEQANRLIARLKEEGIKANYLKYPVYDLEPTGPIINAALRRGLELSDLELQKQFAENRRDFEPQLKRVLGEDVWVVAEDYKGTGIAWGITQGASLDEMEEINRDLLENNLEILLDGQRFASGVEKGHRYEDYANWQKAREVHLMLAERYGWKVVNANQAPNKVADYIWEIVE